MGFPPLGEKAKIEVAWKKRKGSELSVFKGRQARLNHAIFKALEDQSPMAIWDIFRQVTSIKGTKRTKYAVVNSRVKDLEAGNYLLKAGIRDTKQGNKTVLFRTTAKAKLALALTSKNIDDFLNEIDEEAASKILLILTPQRTTLQIPAEQLAESSTSEKPFN